MKDAIHLSEAVPVTVLRTLAGNTAMVQLENCRDDARGFVVGEKANQRFRQDVLNQKQAMDWLKRALKQYEDEALEDLVVEHKTFCRGIGLELGSADEHLNDPRLSPEQRAWLRDFANRWDAVLYPARTP